MSSDDLKRLLAANAPGDLTFVALHASGDDAFDAALRAATSASGKPGFVTLQHPATPIPDAQIALSPYCYRCPIGLAYPQCQIECVDSLRTILGRSADRVAAVVIEAAAEVAGGMITQPPGHVGLVRRICDEHATLLIADERATGGGRSGFLWAVTRDAVVPDIMVTRIATADGSIGATLSRIPVASGDPAPQAVAAAAAHLETITTGTYLGEARRKASNLTDALVGLHGHPRIGDVRVRGLLAGIELVSDKESKEPADAGPVAAAVPHATARGNVLIVAPPLDIDDADLDGIPRAIVAALR